MCNVVLFLYVAGVDKATLFLCVYKAMLFLCVDEAMLYLCVSAMSLLWYVADRVDHVAGLWGVAVEISYYGHALGYYLL